MVIKQSFNGIGIAGAVLAIGGPLATVATAAWSVSGIIEVMTNRYSLRSLDDYAVHPAIYALLLAASTVGWIMVVIGRDYRTEGEAILPASSTATNSAGSMSRLEGFQVDSLAKE